MVAPKLSYPFTNDALLAQDQGHSIIISVPQQGWCRDQFDDQVGGGYGYKASNLCYNKSQQLFSPCCQHEWHFCSAEQNVTKDWNCSCNILLLSASIQHWTAASEMLLCLQEAATFSSQTFTFSSHQDWFFLDYISRDTLQKESMPSMKHSVTPRMPA